MSAPRLTSVTRPAQYRSARSDGSSGVIAAQYASTSPVPTTTPADLSSRAKPVSTPVNAASLPTGGDLREVVPHQIEVVAVLDDGAERVARRPRRQLRFAEETERADPVDGLGHAGRLDQIQLPEPVHRPDHLPGQLRRGIGLADQDDLDLPLRG